MIFPRLFCQPSESLTRLFVGCLRGAIFVFLLALSTTAWCQDPTLRARLETLAKEAGIALSGLHHVGNEPAQDAAGDLPERLRLLLQDYNYLLVSNERGKIDKLVVTSIKQPERKSPAATYVNTQRAGVHHQVEALIVGPGGAPRKIALIVDTGASTIVLPASMQDELGFKPEDLEAEWSRTASGVVAVKTATLRSVQVGSANAENVRVTFMPDRRLGNVMLLGMSFLERFRLILDDARDEMVLQPR